MTSQPQIPSLKGIEKIVINRIAIWELGQTCEDEYCWRKIVGGPGFDPEHWGQSSCKNFSEMRYFINERLSRTRRILLLEHRTLRIFKEEFTYRWWISGTTLNIVRKDMKKVPHAS
jgi:hypothetical protein